MTQYDDGREQAGLRIIEQLGWGQNEGVRELDEDLRELIIQTIPYAGLPKALQAMATFRRVQAGEELKL